MPDPETSPVRMLRPAVKRTAKPRQGDQPRPARAPGKVKLEVVKPEIPAPVTAAPEYFGSEVKALRLRADAIARCNEANGQEFALFIAWAANSGALGFHQRELAARLSVSLMTLQRWAGAKHLPNTIPRRAYLDIIVRLICHRIEMLEAHGVAIGFRSPAKRGRSDERSAAPAATQDVAARQRQRA